MITANLRRHGIVSKPKLGADGISTLMERAENQHRALARKKADGIEDASEPINETLDGQMNRLEAYLHRMVQATEGVSRNILKQKNMLPTLGTAMSEQIHSSNSNYSKQSAMKASSPYKADISRKIPKLATKPYAITPAERAKTIHRKVKVTSNLRGCPQKKICARAVFKKTPTNYISTERI